MKPLTIVILLAAIGATGLSIAQNKVEIDASGVRLKTISIHCSDDTTKKACARAVSPPMPPAPPPRLPAAPAPPAPPAPPALTDLPEPPEPLEPPVPPEPPEIIVPEEVHAACAGKAVGAAASWQREPSAYYGGTCLQSKGKMRLDVHRITLQKS